MKTEKLIHLSILVLTISSCIVIKTRKADDGSSRLSKVDSSLMIPFDPKTASVEYKYNTSKEIKFQVIDASKLTSLVKNKPVSWIFIGASWCGASKYARLRFCKSIRHFEKDSIQLIIIDQDFDLKELQQQQFNCGFYHITYLLDPILYGSDESYKQERFIKDLGLNLPISLFKQGGVPKSIIVDGKLNIYYYASGMDITSDTIAKYTGLRKIN
jgi:hypothetical protein